MPMTDYCADCGEPVGNAETHHVDQQRGNNDPDNRSPRCRQCHMAHHDNDRATDGDAKRTYAPFPGLRARHPSDDAFGGGT